MTARIDSHQHFWRYSPSEYPWMGERHLPIKRDILPTDMQPLLAATDMDGTVAVQARQNLRESEFLLTLAEEYDFVRGVVGWVDLRADDIEAQLERFAAHPRFVGLRHIVHDEADDRFMLGGGFLRGLAALKAYDLRYDLLLFPRHIPIAIDVARQFPQQQFVLDHIAKPFIKDGRLQPWADDIRALAALDNVCCKVSGMVTEAAPGAWTQSDFSPYLDVVFDCFGIERLMFGSDWPVCELAGSYSQVVGIVEAYIAALSADEQAAIMGGNAIDFYRLPAIDDPPRSPRKVGGEAKRAPILLTGPAHVKSSWTRNSPLPASCNSCGEGGCCVRIAGDQRALLGDRYVFMYRSTVYKNFCDDCGLADVSGARRRSVDSAGRSRQCRSRAGRLDGCVQRQRKRYQLQQ